MSTQITEYKCPACTAPLRYDGSSGKLECEYCGGSFTLAEVEKLYAERVEEAETLPSCREIGARTPPECGSTPAPPAARS